MKQSWMQNLGVWATEGEIIAEFAACSFFDECNHICTGPGDMPNVEIRVSEWLKHTYAADELSVAR